MVDIVAQFPAIPDVHGIPLSAFDRDCGVHAADRRLDHVLHVHDGQAVTGNLIAVYDEVQKVARIRPLRITPSWFRELPQHLFHLQPDSLDFVEPGSEDLDAQGRPDTGGEHVDPADDRHRPGVRHPGHGKGVVHLVTQVLHFFELGPPFALRLQVHMVSNISSGAGSVGVSALPAFPKTSSTSGNCFSILSCAWSIASS